jgi:hypothetical protein
VKRRIENFVEGQKLLTPQFTGFRKGYSTIDSIGYLILELQNALTSGNLTVVAFFDIKGAFDNVHLPSLQVKLLSLGIPLYTCLVLHNLLIDRKTFVSGWNRYNSKISLQRTTARLST